MTWQSPSQLVGSSVPSTRMLVGPGNGYGPGSLSSSYWSNTIGTLAWLAGTTLIGIPKPGPKSG